MKNYLSLIKTAVLIISLAGMLSVPAMAQETKKLGGGKIVVRLCPASCVAVNGHGLSPGKEVTIYENRSGWVRVSEFLNRSRLVKSFGNSITAKPALWVAASQLAGQKAKAKPRTQRLSALRRIALPTFRPGSVYVQASQAEPAEPVEQNETPVAEQPATDEAVEPEVETVEQSTPVTETQPVDETASSDGTKRLLTWDELQAKLAKQAAAKSNSAEVSDEEKAAEVKRAETAAEAKAEADAKAVEEAEAAEAAETAKSAEAAAAAAAAAAAKADEEAKAAQAAEAAEAAKAEQAKAKEAADRVKRQQAEAALEAAEVAKAKKAALAAKAEQAKKVAEAEQAAKLARQRAEAAEKAAEVKRVEEAKKAAAAAAATAAAAAASTEADKPVEESKELAAVAAKTEEAEEPIYKAATSQPIKFGERPKQLTKELLDKRLSKLPGRKSKVDKNVVIALRHYALGLLNSGECSGIAKGGASAMPGMLYVVCSDDLTYLRQFPIKEETW